MKLVKVIRTRWTSVLSADNELGVRVDLHYLFHSFKTPQFYAFLFAPDRSSCQNKYPKDQEISDKDIFSQTKVEFLQELAWWGGFASSERNNRCSLNNMVYVGKLASNSGWEDAGLDKCVIWGKSLKFSEP